MFPKFFQSLMGLEKYFHPNLNYIMGFHCKFIFHLVVQVGLRKEYTKKQQNMKKQ
jgi:hypothetical protein